MQILAKNHKKRQNNFHSLDQVYKFMLSSINPNIINHYIWIFLDHLIHYLLTFMGNFEGCVFFRQTLHIRKKEKWPKMGLKVAIK